MMYSDALWENASGDVGVRWPSVTFGTHGTCTTAIVRKKAGKSRACAEHTSVTSCSGDFQAVPLPVMSVWRHFRSKGPTKADIAQLPVAYAQNILPDWALGTWLTSRGHMTSGCSPLLPHKCDFVRAHILLTLFINMHVIKYFILFYFT